MKDEIKSNYLLFLATTTQVNKPEGYWITTQSVSLEGLKLICLYSSHPNQIQTFWNEQGNKW